LENSVEKFYEAYWSKEGMQRPEDVSTIEDRKALLERALKDFLYLIKVGT